jgi:hypothetical protein
MRLIIFFILSCLFFSLSAGSYGYYSSNLFSPPDTISPPPGFASPLTGPASACLGTTCEYYIDVPVACTCQWSVNGVIQSDTTSHFLIMWNQSGLQVVSVAFVCEGGQLSDPEIVIVEVSEMPEPGPISGDELVCAYTYHTYSTLTGPFDSCQWTVNGIIQPGYEPSINYSFGAAGIYQFEVIAFNICGTSNSQTLEVTAQGAAPAPPSQIQGPGESCEGDMATYTTTVGPGESCNWWMDGVLQPTTSTTLIVTWSGWGDHLIEARAVSDCGTGNPTVKNVTVLYLPAVFLGNDTNILQGHTLTLDAGNPGSDYLWSTGETTQTIVVNLTGNYRANVSNYCGADSDTIEVSVITGINEAAGPEDCSGILSIQGKIIFSDFPANILNIQICSYTGMLLYEGKPVDEINIPSPGIYLIRIISEENSCYKKVLIP